MNIERLNEFLDLASTLNFTATAENLHMAQSTLSRHISDLEKTLGFKLFTRSGNGIKLTQEGRELYTKASSLTTSFNSAVADMRTSGRDKTRILRVSGSTLQPTANQLLSMLAVEGARIAPPLRFAYHKSRSLSNEPPSPFSLDMLDKGEIDLALETFPLNGTPPNRFQSCKLREEDIVVLTSSDHPLAQKRGIRLEDLAGCHMVTLAVHKHCPSVMGAPFIMAGMSPEHIEVRYIDNILEIPWNIARLKGDQFVPLQRGFCDYFGFGSGDATVTLNLDDSQAKLSYWAVWKDKEDSALSECIAMLEECLAL